MWGLHSAGSSVGVRLLRKKGTLFQWAICWTVILTLHIEIPHTELPVSVSDSPVSFLARQDFLFPCLQIWCGSFNNNRVTVDLFQWPRHISWNIFVNGCQTQWWLWEEFEVKFSERHLYTWSKVPPHQVQGYPLFFKASTGVTRKKYFKVNQPFLTHSRVSPRNVSLQFSLTHTKVWEVDLVNISRNYLPFSRSWGIWLISN